MKRFFLLTLWLGLGTRGFAQQGNPNADQRFWDTAPTMLNGKEYGPDIVAILHRTVDRNKLSPDLKAQKRIYINFVVDSIGHVGQGKGMLLNGSKVEGYVEDAEIKRAINALPRLVPGKKGGKNVSVSVVVPLY